MLDTTKPVDITKVIESQSKRRNILIEEFNALAELILSTRRSHQRRELDYISLDQNLGWTVDRLNKLKSAMQNYTESRNEVTTRDLLSILSIYLPAMNVAGVSSENSYDPAASIIRIQVSILEESIAPVIKLCSQAIANNIKNSIPELVSDGGDQLVPAPLNKQ